MFGPDRRIGRSVREFSQPELFEPTVEPNAGLRPCSVISWLDLDLDLRSSRSMETFSGERGGVLKGRPTSTEALVPDGAVGHCFAGVCAAEIRLTNERGQHNTMGTARLPISKIVSGLKTGFGTRTSVLREELGKTSMFEEVIGTSSVLQMVLAHAAKVAPTDSTVLILGETGTGRN